MYIFISKIEVDHAKVVNVIYIIMDGNFQRDIYFSIKNYEFGYYEIYFKNF